MEHFIMILTGKRFVNRDCFFLLKFPTVQCIIIRMRETITFVLKQTFPVMMGYLFLGMAFGLMLNEIGLNFVWAFFMSLFIFAGSLQYVLVGLLSGGASLISTAVMTLSVNSRHIFYGLSFLKDFKAMGKAYPYMIFSLTDETYALLCSMKYPEGMNKKRATLLIAAFDQSYWVIGSTLGGVLGALITFDMTGIDFVMTALFTVIAVEQWLEAKSHIPAFVGLACGAASLMILGPDKFIVPAIIAAIGILLICKKVLSGEEAQQ